MECKFRDITIHYEEVGSGKPLLVLHGWGLNGRIAMNEIDSVFAGRSGWRRIYPDLPGHANTPLPDWLYEHDDLVDILLEFMDAVAPGEHFGVAGVSWGGYVARGIVHQRPKQVDGVMLFVPCIILDSSKRNLPDQQVIHPDAAFAAALRPDEEWMLDVIVAQSSALLDSVRANFAGSEIVEEMVARRLYDHPFTFNVDVLPEPCPAPALFLMGRQDNVVGYKDTESVLESYPRGTFAVLDRAGHLLGYEQPTLVQALIGEWLDRVEEYVAGNEG